MAGIQVQVSLACQSVEGSFLLRYVHTLPTMAVYARKLNARSIQLDREVYVGATIYTYSTMVTQFS